MKPLATSIRKFGRVVALPVLGLTGLVLAGTATAQDDSDDEGFLEEIIVVSKVRGEQNVMDVPVAITAVTGAQIEASGIKDMFDMQQNVPGLIVGHSQTATTSNFAVRGIGSTSNNFGVESSVGLYVDGVYRSRQSSMINELVDVEAVEVLRGPQGTLFGKNTAAGAINVRTVAPSPDSADAFLELTAGNYDLRRVAAATNIPLTDKLAFRGTIFASKRDGYVDNYTYDLNPLSPSVKVDENLFNDRDRIGLRLQLGYDNGDDFDMRIIGDYSEIDEVCCVGMTNTDGLFSHAGINQGVGIPGPGFARMSLGNIVFTDFDYPDILPTAGFLGVDIPRPPNVITGVKWGDYITSYNDIPISQNSDGGLSIEMNKYFENDMTLTSVTAYRSFDTFDFIDVDFSDTDMARRTNDANQESISQELRLAGSFGDSSRWVVGAYYFSQDIKSNTVTTAGSQLQAFVDIGQTATGQPTLQSITDGVTAISQGLALAGIPFPEGAPAIPNNMFANDDVLQEHDGYAVFSQVDWAISDAFELSLGARYTKESKDITATYTQTNPGVAAPDLTAIGTTFALFQQWVGGGMVGAPPDLTPLLAVAEPNTGWFAWTIPSFSPRPDIRDSLDDDQVTGTAKLTWFINDAMMVYGSYATGFKSGGTNTDRIPVSLSQTFNAEKSDSLEFGFKGDITDRLRVAANYYKTDFTDFQANSFTGTAFNLRNAGDLSVEGVELEWQWALMDELNVSGYYAHNKGTYNSFDGATCQLAGPFHSQTPDPGLDPMTGICNRDGESIPYNPKDRVNLGITQNFPMNSGNLFVRAEYAWFSDTATDGDNDPLTIQNDYGILNLRLGLDLDEWNSTVTLWGRNVTDERYWTGSFDAPLQDGRLNSYASEPATWGITFRKNWD